MTAAPQQKVTGLVTDLQRGEVLVLIGNLLSDQFHQQHPPAVYISPAVVQLVADHLWRHVQVGASLPRQHPHAFWGQPPR